VGARAIFGRAIYKTSLKTMALDLKIIDIAFYFSLVMLAIFLRAFNNLGLTALKTYGQVRVSL